MKIEIKNIKFSGFATQETHCFQATVYIDGKKSFITSNEGHGGCNDYQPCGKSADRKTVYAQIKAIDEILSKEKVKFGEDDKYEIENSLEIVIGNLMNEWLTEKEVKKTLKKITYFRDGNVYTLPAKYKPTPEALESVQKTKWWKKEYILLNLLDIKDAAKYFI